MVSAKADLEQFVMQATDPYRRNRLIATLIQLLTEYEVMQVQAHFIKPKDERILAMYQLLKPFVIELERELDTL